MIKTADKNILLKKVSGKKFLIWFVSCFLIGIFVGCAAAVTIAVIADSRIKDNPDWRIFHRKATAQDVSVSDPNASLRTFESYISGFGSALTLDNIRAFPSASLPHNERGFRFTVMPLYDIKNLQVEIQFTNVEGNILASADYRGAFVHRFDFEVERLKQYQIYVSVDAIVDINAIYNSIEHANIGMSTEEKLQATITRVSSAVIALHGLSIRVTGGSIRYFDRPPRIG